MKIYSRLGVCAVVVAASTILLCGCQKTAAGGGDTTTSAETAQQVGDQAASRDESTVGGTSRLTESAQRVFERLSPGELVVSKHDSVDRTSCLFNAGFSTCTAGQRVLTLGDCT